jgi:hypothetical protein
MAEFDISGVNPSGSTAIELCRLLVSYYLRKYKTLSRMSDIFSLLTP